MAAEPDFGRLEMALRRRGTPDRVPLIELFSDVELTILRALGELRPRPSADEVDWHLRQHLAHQLALGYDYLKVLPDGFHFPRAERAGGLTAEGWRYYQRAAARTIADWDDFGRYPWPDPTAADLRPLDRAARLMPRAMRLLTGVTGVMERALPLLGYEGLGYLLHDDEELVAATLDQVGQRVLAMVEALAQHPAVGAVYVSDDLGFRTQTLVSPALLRRYVFPWHRRLTAAVHACDKPVILHTCGNLAQVMEDVIACGWDAKHSFEDAIEPVWEAKARWGDRLALLGGFDMDRLTRGSVAQVRAHAERLLATCAAGGGYALGTGNSVTSYVPLANYFEMVRTGLSWRGAGA
jgi:uroporphyrinogen decarboxylase